MYKRSLILALTEISKFGDVAGTKSFVEICTNVTSSFGFKASWTPLTYAALHGHVAVLSILLAASRKWESA